MVHSRMIFCCAAAASLLMETACMTQESAERSVRAMSEASGRVDSLPAMLNESPPFLYPADLYEKKIQANVTLRIFIDSTGAVLPESTSIATPSGYAGLDSAAIEGATRLRFAPAKSGERAVSTPVLFPVYFRYPGAPPLPGDTILHRSDAGAPPPTSP
jgi:TonB family protein